MYMLWALRLVQDLVASYLQAIEIQGCKGEGPLGCAPGCEETTEGTYLSTSFEVVPVMSY